MQTLLVEVGIITLCIVAHLYVDIIILYSVMYITPYPKEKIIYIYIQGVPRVKVTTSGECSLC